MTPGNGTLLLYGFVQYNIYETGTDCYNNYYSTNVTSYASWSSSDSSVATVSGGLVEAVGTDLITGESDVEISASVDIIEYMYYGFCTGGGGGPFLTSNKLNWTSLKERIFSFKNISYGINNTTPTTLLPDDCDCITYTTYANLNANITVEAKPVITQISPIGSVRDDSPMVQFVGSYFGDNPTLNVTGNGIITQFENTVGNPNGFISTFQVAANADIGERQVTVTGSNGLTSLPIAFTVGDATPVITSISENQGSTGQILNVTITGTNFGAMPNLIVGSGIETTIQTATDTQINTIFAVGNSAPPGPRDIKVKSNGFGGGGFTTAPQQVDTSDPVTFSINSPVVTLGEIKHIEKNGTVSIPVTVSGIPFTESIELRTRTVSGSGSAAFSDGGSGTSTSLMVSGGTNQTFLIKGLTTSSSVDNIALEARHNSNTIKSELFSVAEITTLEFERIHITPNTSNGNEVDPPLDNNPGVDGTHTAEEGLRIYRGRTSPNNTTDRSILRVKATIAPANLSKASVFFGSYDLDDPSANIGPIDPGDATGTPANDNRGSVPVTGGTSKSGAFSAPSGGNCDPATSANNVSKIGCQISGTNASANIKVPINPGDNIAIAASLDGVYRDQIVVQQSSPTNLANSANEVVIISGSTNSQNVQGIRTKMLTVWRKLHLEIDKVGTVNTTNRWTGTVTAGITNQPAGVGAIGISITGLQDNQLERGRAVIGGTGGTSYKILQSGVSGGQPAIALELTQSTTISAGIAITVYDDDDYDDLDGNSKDGDSGEPFNELGETFKYITDQDGNYPDGQTMNIYRSAYITPSRVWAQAQPNYIQNNVTFALHSPSNSPPTGNNPVLNALNANRNSAADERDDFWIAYFLLGYQPEITEDGDGYIPDPTPSNPNNTTAEGGVAGIATGSPVHGCDCLTAPCTGLVCPTTGIPQGGVGAFIFQEILQDTRTSWLEVPVPPVISNNMGLTAPHELGHQLGLEGDQTNPLNPNRTPGGPPPRTGNTYLMMDYSNQQTGPAPYVLHPQHINLLRSRIASPGR